MTLQDYFTRNLQDLQLRGMSASYVRSVRKISEHYNKLPDQITEAERPPGWNEIREYFLYLKNVRKYGRSASALVSCQINIIGYIAWFKK